MCKEFPKSGASFSLLLHSAPKNTFGKLSGFKIDYLQYIVNPEFLARSWSEDFEELCYLWEEYLEREMKLVEVLPDMTTGSYRITPRGWAYIDSFHQANPNSQIGFIAMWFSDSVNDAWQAIDNGIRNAGYKPFRVDQKQHNNKIDDEIIAGIRGSKFLVADLTGHRGGVYYEAGFAQGLGLEVIWLCRSTDMEKMHFDIRQYNTIFWEQDKLADLTKALKDRIEARFGHGPLNEST